MDVDQCCSAAVVIHYRDGDRVTRLMLPKPDGADSLADSLLSVCVHGYKHRPEPVQTVCLPLTSYRYCVPSAGNSSLTLSIPSSSHTPGPVQRVVEQDLTFNSTQFRSFRRLFYRSDDPTNSVKALKLGG